MTNPMHKTWTRTALVARRLKAGPKRRSAVLLDPTEAVLEQALVLHRTWKTVRDAWLDTSNLSYMVRSVGQDDQLAGIVFTLLDPDTGKRYSWEHTWIPQGWPK
jgi:hypothetical protein